MLTTLLAAIAFQSPNLDKPVTLRTVAKPVADVLADVTTQVGFRFEASQVRDWPIIVSVKAFRAGDLLERIAEVTDSEWVKERDRWVLTRSAARVKKAVEVELADRAARLKPVVDALPTEMTEEDLIKAQAEVEKVRSQIRAYGGNLTTSTGGPSPAVGLMNALVKRIPIQELAAAPINSFVAYSSAPTRGQVRLVGLSNDLLKGYRSARERFAAKVKVPAEVKMVASEAAKPLLSGSKFTLVLSRPGATANINVGLFVYGPDHHLLDATRSTLAPVTSKLDDAQAPVQETLRFSRDALASIEAFRYRNATLHGQFTVTSGDIVVVRSADPWVTDANVAFARRAVESEPTAFAISEWLLDLADRLGDGLVACLPDHTFVALSERLTPTVTHDVLWNLIPTLGLTRARTGGLLIVKSQFFARADRYRVNRTALRKLVHAAGPYGLPKLADVLDYVASAPPITVSSNLDVHLLSLLFMRNEAGLGHASSVAGLRLLRLITAREPGTNQLTLGELQSRYGAAYDAVVRAQYASLAFGSRPVEGNDMPFELSTNPYGEPVQDSATVAMEIKKRDFDWVLLVLGDGTTHRTGPAGLGAFVGLKSENMSGFSPVLHLRSLHPAKVVEQRISIRTGASSVGVFHQDVLANLDQRWTVADLPQGWRDAFEQGKSQGQAMKITQNSGGNVPP